MQQSYATVSYVKRAEAERLIEAFISARAQASGATRAAVLDMTPDSQAAAAQAIDASHQARERLIKALMGQDAPGHAP